MSKRLALFVTITVLAVCLLACHDWDGMDRSQWHAGPTPTAVTPPGPVLPLPPGGGQ